MNCQVMGTSFKVFVFILIAISVTSFKSGVGSGELTSLDHSVKPFWDYFNSNKEKRRFVALLSPTSKYFTNGVKAIQGSILDKSPETDISISIVWIDILDDDDLKSAATISHTLKDPRVRHFHDLDQLLGKAIADALSANETKAWWESTCKSKSRIAWEFYMVFDSSITWHQDKTPVPATYIHQLPRKYFSWADAERYHTGDDFIAALNSMILK